jgi:hypothetical protein
MHATSLLLDDARHPSIGRHLSASILTAFLCAATGRRETKLNDLQSLRTLPGDVSYANTDRCTLADRAGSRSRPSGIANSLAAFFCAVLTVLITRLNWISLPQPFLATRGRQVSAPPDDPFSCAKLLSA